MINQDTTIFIYYFQITIKMSSNSIYDRNYFKEDILPNCSCENPAKICFYCYENLKVLEGVINLSKFYLRIEEC